MYSHRADPALVFCALFEADDFRTSSTSPNSLLLSALPPRPRQHNYIFPRRCRLPSRAQEVLVDATLHTYKLEAKAKIKAQRAAGKTGRGATAAAAAAPIGAGEPAYIFNRALPPVSTYLQTA